MIRYTLLSLAVLLSPGHRAAAQVPEKPNLVVIFCDDLGYGDLGVQGHPSIRTPNLDRMATEGMRFTDFYVAASVCTPSRGALLTGRLPVRNGTAETSTRRVFYPGFEAGLPPEEITIAELLGDVGYATACIGKWHLGDHHPFLPTDQGFDEFFGLPYSNDMGGRVDTPDGRMFDVPLLRGDETIERPVRQDTLTQRYTDEALTFIERNAEKPFFLYLAHTMPHTPLHASDGFVGQSPRGLYGDVVEELDASVGLVLETLRERGIAERTLVVFTSDNGPWLKRNLNGGSAGLLREGKGSTWEGGVRVPAIAWWPGTIEAGTVRRDVASTLDLLPTAVALAGAELPSDRELDGYDLLPSLKDATAATPRKVTFHYRSGKLSAVRMGLWKAHYITQSGYGPEEPVTHNPPLLFNLAYDPSETTDLADRHPDVLDQIDKHVARHRETLSE